MKTNAAWMTAAEFKTMRESYTVSAETSAASYGVLIEIEREILCACCGASFVAHPEYDPEWTYVRRGAVRKCTGFVPSAPASLALHIAAAEFRS